MSDIVEIFKILEYPITVLCVGIAVHLVLKGIGFSFRIIFGGEENEKTK